MDITGTSQKVRLSTRGITGWALIVASPVIGLSTPPLSGGTIASWLTAGAGCYLVARVVGRRTATSSATR